MFGAQENGSCACVLRVKLSCGLRRIQEQSVVDGPRDETGGRVSSFTDEVDSAHLLEWGRRKEGGLRTEAKRKRCTS